MVGEEKQAGAEAPENKHAARTAAHKAKLAADPRFAAWQGLSPACLPSCTPDLCRASPDGFCDEGAA